MESAEADRGAWSRQLWVVVGALTAMGVIGTWVLFLVLFPLNQPVQAGCGGLGGVLFFFMLLVLLVVGLIAVLAAAGLILFWLRSRWAPVLLVLSNAMAMGFFGLIYPVPGPPLWVVVVLLLGAAPAIAVGLLIWPLVTRGRLGTKVIELVVLGLFALPFLWLYPTGVTRDIQTAMAPPPQVASTGCSGSAELPRMATTP